MDSREVGGTRGASSITDIRADLNRIRAWAGLDAVAGDGITITTRGRSGAAQVEDVANELHNAGAEPIAIDGARVVTGTVIGGLPGSISVDDTPLGDPFTIRAHGGTGCPTGALERGG